MSDELAREKAIDPQWSVLLQAPAGSGKTTVLTQRFLKLLSVVEEPEQMLAITFTRKAAAEMRARVLKALKDAKAGVATRERTGKLAAAALERSDMKGWGLLEQPGRLRIQTIDSFNFSLASQLPLAAKVGGGLTVADRPEEAYSRAARATLLACEQDETLAADIDLLFERLDNSFRRVERLLADMLQRRGHWLRFVLGHDPTALRERISSSLEEVVGDQLILACERLSSSLRELAACLPDVGSLGADPRYLPRWQRLAAIALTQKGEWRKPRGITRALGPEFEDGAVKQNLRDCIERWSAADGALEMLLEIDALPDPRLAEEDGRALEALSRVLRFAATQLQLEFAVSGKVDYTYVAGAAREALTEFGEPTDLALRAGLALRHILVDEFQDTSLGQFDLLEALTATWSEGDGRTLFVVGDPMQSIYQFREAEVGLFLRARDRGIGMVRLTPLKLTRNFRSARKLIEWSNQVFTGLFPRRDDLRASAVAFTPSEAAREDLDQAAVTLELFEDRTQEAQTLAQRIAAIRKATPQATIAVLVASRSHAAPLMGTLGALEVPVIGVDLVALAELSIVRDLTALLTALHDLADRTAWLTVLRAPWCGLTLATLSQLSDREDELLVWEALQDPQRLHRCEEGERGRIERVRGVLAQALMRRDRLSPAEWLERVWIDLGGPDAYALDELSHARALFTALGERVASGEWRGVRDIDTLVADLFAQPQASDPNPVQIMTIHRAKGLEFDHVFLPALDRMLNRDREPLLRWLDLPRVKEGSDLLMAPVPPIGEKTGGRLNAYLKRLTETRAANERARLMYVAVTRAKETLHLSGAPAPRSDGEVGPRSGTLLACLWEVLQGQFKSAVGADTAHRDVAPPAVLLRRLASDWAPADRPAGVEPVRLPVGHQSLAELEFSWAGETLRHIGTVVHAALEQIGKLAVMPSVAEIEASRSLYRQQLRRLGVRESELDDATRTVVAALVRTLGDERGRWVFDPTHREAHSELALTGIANGRLTTAIIDRSFIDIQNVRWVVDFKTSRHGGGDRKAFLATELERYRPQLQTYVALASKLGPEPVRAGLYFPLLAEFVEF